MINLFPVKTEYSFFESNEKLVAYYELETTAYISIMRMANCSVLRILRNTNIYEIKVYNFPTIEQLRSYLALI